MLWSFLKYCYFRWFSWFFHFSFLILALIDGWLLEWQKYPFWINSKNMTTWYWLLRRCWLYLFSIFIQFFHQNITMQIMEKVNFSHFEIRHNNDNHHLGWNEANFEFYASQWPHLSFSLGFGVILNFLSFHFIFLTLQMKVGPFCIF